MKLFQEMKTLPQNQKLYVYIKNYLIGFGTLDEIYSQLKPYEYKDIKRITFKKDYIIIDL